MYVLPIVLIFSIPLNFGFSKSWRKKKISFFLLEPLRKSYFIEIANDFIQQPQALQSLFVHVVFIVKLLVIRYGRKHDCNARISLVVQVLRRSRRQEMLSHVSWKDIFQKDLKTVFAVNICPRKAKKQPRTQLTLLIPLIVSTSSCSTFSLAFQRKSVLDVNSIWRSRTCSRITTTVNTSALFSSNGSDDSLEQFCVTFEQTPGRNDFTRRRARRGILGRSGSN